MAYQTNTLSSVFDAINRTMIDLKSRSQAVSASAAGAGLTSSQILSYYADLWNARNALSTAAAVPGIALFAQNQADSTSYDVVSAFNSVIAAIDSTTSWITTNFPQSGGFIQGQSFTNNTVQDRQFIAAQLTVFKTVVDALVATIS